MFSKSLLPFLITAFLSFYSFTSCKDDSSVSDFKLTKTSFEAINNAIIAATKGQSPKDIKAGQYYKYEDNYQVELNEPSVNAIYEGSVLDVSETDTQYTIRILETITSYSGSDTPDVDQREDIFIIDKIKAQNLKSLSPRGTFTKSLTPLSNYTTRGTVLEAYNLVVSQSYIAYPQAIQNRLNCNPADPCKFLGTRIKFKLHEYINKGTPKKIAVDRIYINNGNFLTGLFSSCQSQFLDIGERDYYVKQCSVLRDFEGE